MVTFPRLLTNAAPNVFDRSVGSEFRMIIPVPLPAPGQHERSAFIGLRSAAFLWIQFFRFSWRTP